MVAFIELLQVVACKIKERVKGYLNRLHKDDLIDDDTSNAGAKALLGTRLSYFEKGCRKKCARNNPVR